MHHPGLLLLLGLLVLLIGPSVGQGLAAIGTAAGPLLASAPGYVYLSNLAASTLAAAMLILGVLVVAVIKIVVGS